MIPHRFLSIFRRVMFTVHRRRKLVIATHNNHKQKEISAFLGHMDIDILGLDDFPQIKDIEETGNTLIDNSFIKARTVYRITGLPSLADDTGLEVDALNGAPGVFSARYAGENPSYNANVNKLLDNLDGIPLKKRNARFKTVMAFVDNKKELFTEGVIEGLITLSSQGDQGFGYDPIFKPEGYDKTFAEFDLDEKNRISHRSRALKKMVKILESNLIKENK